MDCDGPKHALIDDRDGTFLGTHPLKGSVVPFAELRYRGALSLTHFSMKSGENTLTGTIAVGS